MEPNMVSGRGFRNEAPAFCVFWHKKGNEKNFYVPTALTWGGGAGWAALFSGLTFYGCFRTLNTRM